MIGLVKICLHFLSDKRAIQRPESLRPDQASRCVSATHDRTPQMVTLCLSTMSPRLSFCLVQPVSLHLLSMTSPFFPQNVSTLTLRWASPSPKLSEHCPFLLYGLPSFVFLSVRWAHLPTRLS